MLVGYSRSFGPALEEVIGEATLLASSEAHSGFAIEFIADKSSGTAWGSGAANTQWIQADFGVGNAKDIRRTALEAIGSVGERMPNTWTLAGSDTGAFTGEEAEIHTVTDGEFYGDAEKKVFNFDNGTAFRYYRLTMTDKEGAFGVSFEYEIAEWELYATV